MADVDFCITFGKCAMKNIELVKYIVTL